MYKKFVEMCDQNGYKCTLLDALYYYGTFNYQEILHPKLKDRVEIPYQIDISTPISDSLRDKLPKFENEELPRQKIESTHFVNANRKIGYFPGMKADETIGWASTQTRIPRIKKKFFDNRKFANKMK